MHRTEITLVHKIGKLELLVTEQRLCIDSTKYFLAIRIAAFIGDGKNDAFGNAVSVTEGYENPNPRQDGILQVFGNPIIIGSVDRIQQTRKSHTCKHRRLRFDLSDQRMVSFPV